MKNYQKGAKAMRERIDRAAALWRGSWKTLFLFEILYRLFTTYVFFPACKWLFNSCLRVTRLYYLSAENLVRFLSNPLMLLCCAVLLLAFSLAAILEISCLITCLHAAGSRTLGIFQLIQEGLRDVARCLYPCNWSLLLITAFLLPITQLPSSTSPLRLINLPWGTIGTYALQYPYVLITLAYAAAAVLFFGLAMCAYHRFVLEDTSSASAFRGAYLMNRGRRIHRLVELAVWMIVVCGLVFGAATVLAKAGNRLVTWITDDLNVQYHIRLPFSTALSFAKNSLPFMACYAYITAVYHSAKAELGEPLPESAVPHRRNARRFNAITFYVTVALCVLCLVLYDTLLRPMLVRYDALEFMSSRPTLIIAHRGFFKDTDENTLSAFNAAIEMGVDYVELDVQQTADGVVIVNHDNSFRRVFGDKRNVWETTYSEVRELTGTVSGECPPTLHEVLTLCNPQANLLIELKNNGHNPGLVQAVYDILVEYECFDRCIIQSSSYRMLRQFKELAPDVRCGYILSFALGDYATLDAADFFSIDYSFIDEAIVNAIHRLGKDVFVWTINDTPRMSKLIALGVDGIITDEAPLAKTLLLDADASPLDALIAEPLEGTLTPLEEDASEKESF